MTLADAIAARAIAAYITSKAKGLSRMGFLAGYRTYIISALMVLIGAADLAGFLPQALDLAIVGSGGAQALIWGGVMGFLGRRGAANDAAKAQAGLIPPAKVAAVREAASK